MEADQDKTRTHTILTKGTMISHYRIIERIGAGGMGEVAEYHQDWWARITKSSYCHAFRKVFGREKTF